MSRNTSNSSTDGGGGRKDPAKPQSTRGAKGSTKPKHTRREDPPTEDTTSVTTTTAKAKAAAEAPPISKSKSEQKRKKSPLTRWLLQGTIHLACIVLYLIPILTPNEFIGPTLDEAHVMAEGVQRDIHDPNASWEQIFSNDYWGRPMNSPSSHKSWRPLTVLTFRFLKGPYLDVATQSIQQLTVHRFVNIVCHAAVGELVGQLATQLFVLDSDKSAMWLQLITKVLFCLHPTHVEVTANAANRSHLLAVLLGLILCFPGISNSDSNSDSNSNSNSSGKRRQRLKITTPFWLFLVALICGYLCSETFVFIIPGVMVTMTVITFKGSTPRISQGTPKTDEGENSNGDKSSELKKFVVDYLRAILSASPRLVLLAASVGTYLVGRAYFDTLDIPTGLIRPAESPYYEFEGAKRFKNYLYVVTIHLGKQWGLVLPNFFGGDPIGFSHEYGFDCIPEIKAWNDDRFLFGVGFHVLLAVVISVLLVSYNARQFFGLVAIHWSWTLFTLFPICGILKVGTFVSDRIVVPSSIVASIWIGKVVHSYATNWVWKKDSAFCYFRPLQFIFIVWWIGTSYMTVHNRSLDWMDSITLMNSALVTCPRFAKVHMEVSKIYSGLYPSQFDLQKARTHLDTAREIDPDLCDLHKQYVYVGLQEHKYREVEKEMTLALLCPFTSSGTEPLFQNYWSQALKSVPAGTPQHAEIEARYKAEMAIIQAGLLKEQREKEANGLKWGE